MIWLFWVAVERFFGGLTNRRAILGVFRCFFGVYRHFSALFGVFRCAYAAKLGVPNLRGGDAG